jgi:hypothetical protein
MIRRSIAGLILGPSLLIGSLAWSGFVALRTIFDPDRSSEVAEELLDNDEVMSQLTENVANAIEALLPAGVGLSDEQIEQVAGEILEDPEVEEAVLEAFAAAHGAFLGENDAPQTLDLTAASDALSAAVADVTGLESPAEVPALRVELPTDRIPDAGPIRDFFEASVPILAAMALAGCLLALLTTTDRSAVLTKAGIWALSSTAFFLVLGFGVPWLLGRYAPDQAQVFGALVTALLRTTLIPSVVLALCGVAAIVVAIMWPTAEQREARRAAEAPGPARSAAQGPVWPGPVPQPLVYPEPDWEAVRRKSSELPRRRPTDATVASPRSGPDAHPTPTGPTPAPAEPTPAPPPVVEPRRTGPPADRPSPAAQPRPDLPPPLPTVASVSRSRSAESPERDTAERSDPGPTRLADPGRGSSSRLPTQEQDDRPRKWLPPRWVEGHGWVMDPSDPRPPPPNAKWVDGVGHVVPGPPPNDD